MDSINNDRLIESFGNIDILETAFKKANNDDICINSFGKYTSAKPQYVVAILVIIAVLPIIPCGANFGLKKLSFIRKNNWIENFHAKN